MGFLFGSSFAYLGTREVCMKARILTIPFLAASSLLAVESSPDTRLRHSIEAFQDVMKSPDKYSPRQRS